MDLGFADQLRLLSQRIAANKDNIQTEEATKNAMVMPLIQILGYNVFDPTEVTPELVADIGTKKGEKVDYAILKDGKPIILFECKAVGADLHINHASQLFRYFAVVEARFGVLTNGVQYRFYSDLSKPNVMDDRPFFEFNILDFKDRDVTELKKFTSEAFDLNAILTAAEELKYIRTIQNRLNEWIASPSEEFVRLASSDLLAGKRFTPAMKDQLTLATKRAFEQLIGEKINERLKGAMTPEVPAPVATQAVEMPADDSSQLQIVTTPEEIEGFHCVKMMLREIVDPARISIRDAQSYCAILLDDNNRKPICRLRFNNPQRLRLGVFSDRKEEQQYPLESIYDILNYSEQMRETLKAYLDNRDAVLG